MPSPELESLVTIGRLKREPPIREEYDGLLQNAAVRLEDARKDDLHTETRFDLAYAAAHSLAVAALRRLGYRSENRQVVFRALAHTLGIPAPIWRLLAKCHDLRNQRDYEGLEAVEERLVEDLFAAAEGLLEALRRLPPPDLTR